MKKINLLLIFALFLSVAVSAQLASNDYAKNYANLMNTKKKTEATHGSPYLFEEWESGVVVFKGEEGGEFKNIKLDLMNSQLEVLYMNAEKVLPADEFQMVRIDRVGLHAKTFFQKASVFKYNKKRLKGFAQVTPLNDDYKVVVTHSVRIIKSNMNAKVVGADHRKRIVRDTKTFISKKGKLYRIKRKKDLYKLLTKKQKKLKAYISDHDLSVKKQEDLIQIVEFYVSM